jgi:hypothetical protein
VIHSLGGARASRQAEEPPQLSPTCLRLRPPALRFTSPASPKFLGRPQRCLRRAPGGSEDAEPVLFQRTGPPRSPRLWLPRTNQARRCWPRTASLQLTHRLPPLLSRRSLVTDRPRRPLRALSPLAWRAAASSSCPTALASQSRCRCLSTPTARGWRPTQTSRQPSRRVRRAHVASGGLRCMKRRGLAHVTPPDKPPRAPGPASQPSCPRTPAPSPPPRPRPVPSNRI